MGNIFQSNKENSISNEKYEDISEYLDRINNVKEELEREKLKLERVKKETITQTKLKKLFNTDNPTEEELDTIQNSNSFLRCCRIRILKDQIKKFKSELPDETLKNIEELQELLVGNKLPENTFEYICLNRSFDFKFGENISNEDFISYVRKSILTLYSTDKIFKDNAFKLFKNIQKKIKDFLYIPMLEQNTLCEFKKHIYLGVLSSQKDLEDQDSLTEYILYDDLYFNITSFHEIKFNIKRDEKFIKTFSDYTKEHEFKLNLETIKDYMFSQTIKEAYLETCREIFGNNASFVNMKNIEKALNKIYEDVIKNLKFAKLEPFYYGVTLYNKKVLISNNFDKNIKESTLDRKKLSFMAGLVMTLLHEITHCLSNILPLYSDDYNELSNPFIRIFKKNIAIYDFVTGKKEYKSEKNVIDILKEKINNYKYIKDSGSLFESKLFTNIHTSSYLDSEYFLNINNLKQPLKIFKEGYNDFMGKSLENDLKYLNDETSVSFRRTRDVFYYGRCMLDSGKEFMIME